MDKLSKNDLFFSEEIADKVQDLLQEELKEVFEAALESYHQVAGWLEIDPTVDKEGYFSLAISLFDKKITVNFHDRIMTFNTTEKDSSKEEVVLQLEMANALERTANAIKESAIKSGWVKHYGNLIQLKK